MNHYMHLSTFCQSGIPQEVVGASEHLLFISRKGHIISAQPAGNTFNNI